MREPKVYIVKMVGEGLFHHAAIADEDDLILLDVILAKVRKDASSAVDALRARDAKGERSEVPPEGRTEPLEHPVPEGNAPNPPEKPDSSDAPTKEKEQAGVWIPGDIDEVRKAFNYIKEIGKRYPMTTNDQTIALHQMVKWANHGLASLPSPPQPQGT